LEAAVESLHEIEELVAGFPENGKIPAIEIDLALQKLRNLYELLLLMRGSEKGAVEAGAATDTREQPASSGAMVIEEKPAMSAIVNIEKKPEPESSENDNIKSEATVIIVEESKKTTVSVTSEEEKSIKKAGASKKPAVEIQTLADQFKGRPTLLETLSQSYNHDHETQVRSKPVADLMGAIALNERFTFIRELFNNDKKAFELAIATLNDSGSFNNAYNYLSKQFNWDMDGEAVQLLLSIIRRKYVK